MTSGSPDVIVFLDTYPNVAELEKKETQPVRFELMLSPIGFEPSESDEGVGRRLESEGAVVSEEVVGVLSGKEPASADVLARDCAG